MEQPTRLLTPRRDRPAIVPPLAAVCQVISDGSVPREIQTWSKDLTDRPWAALALSIPGGARIAAGLTTAVDWNREVTRRHSRVSGLTRRIWSIRWRATCSRPVSTWA
jgi:hypothetical protein